MKSVKRILSAVIACVMLMAVAVPFAAFAEGAVQVMGGGAETAPGGEAVVHISIDGAKIGAFQLTVSFDASKLQFVKCEASEELAGIANDGGAVYLVNDNNADNGSIIIGCAITEGAVFTVAPLDITFKAAEVDETAHVPVNITVDRLRTELDEALESEVTNGGVTINVVHIESIEFTDESKELEIGEEYTPEYTVNPDGYTDEFAPVWTSDNDEVASVDENGKITAIREGTANITITNGEISATLPITVNAAVPPVMKGDMDKDGEISVNDALKALRIAAKLAVASEEDMQIGDVDGDGDITVNDALKILRVAAKLADQSSLEA
ncbi:MAG: Ig-like domain-containing protein [Clostridia bacterium]|nr:Ig-like domain-containing protein [Clostridia bacterium]